MVTLETDFLVLALIRAVTLFWAYSEMCCTWKHSLGNRTLVLFYTRAFVVIIIMFMVLMDLDRLQNYFVYSWDFQRIHHRPNWLRHSIIMHLRHLPDLVWWSNFHLYLRLFHHRHNQGGLSIHYLNFFYLILSRFSFSLYHCTYQILEMNYYQHQIYNH